MRMTGTQKSFEAWVLSKAPNAYFYRNTIRQAQGKYSVVVPELKIEWYGDAMDANEARTLAVEEFERRKNPVKNDNTLYKYSSDFAQKLRWSNKAEARAALKLVVGYSKDFANSAEERALYRQVATIIRRWLKDFATEQRGRARNPRKKNPEAEIRELIMFAENSPSLHNQLVSIMLNLSRKHKRGIYDPTLAAKLWKYWIDEAVKQYNKEILGGGYSLKQNVFTMDDRREAAIEMEEQQRDEVQTLEYLTNPSHISSHRKKKKATRKKNPKSKLWQIALFEPHNHVIHFYGGVSRGKIAFTQQRAKGILLKTKAEAKKIAETVPEFYRKRLKFNVAVVPASMTLPKLRQGLGVPPGKA